MPVSEHAACTVPPGDAKFWQKLRTMGAVTEILEKLYMGDSDVISMPAGFRRHLVGKTVINVFHCDIAEIRFVGELVNFDRTINLRTLTPHIMPFYTHKKWRSYRGHRFYDVTSPCALWSELMRVLFCVNKLNIKPEGRIVLVHITPQRYVAEWLFI